MIDFNDVMCAHNIYFWHSTVIYKWLIFCLVCTIICFRTVSSNVYHISVITCVIVILISTLFVIGIYTVFGFYLKIIDDYLEETFISLPQTRRRTYMVNTVDCQVALL